MIDDRVREYLFPVRIPAAEGVCDPEDLLGECELQIATMESRTVRIAGGGFVILDFGRELYGGIRILTKNCRAGAR